MLHFFFKRVKFDCDFETVTNRSLGAGRLPPVTVTRILETFD